MSNNVINVRFNSDITEQDIIDGVTEYMDMKEEQGIELADFEASAKNLLRLHSMLYIIGAEMEDQEAMPLMMEEMETAIVDGIAALITAGNMPCLGGEQ